MECKGCGEEFGRDTRAAIGTPGWCWACSAARDKFIAAALRGLLFQDTGYAAKSLAATPARAVKIADATMKARKGE